MKKLMLIICMFFCLAVAANAQTRISTADPVEKAKELQGKLKLTDAQTTKIAAIYQESAQKFDKIKADEKGNNDKMLVAIRPLRANTIQKIKAVLTPAQKASYDKMVKGSGKASTGWSDGWSATGTN